MNTHTRKIGRLELIVIQTQDQDPEPALEMFPTASLELLEVARAAQPEFCGHTSHELLFTQNICAIRSVDQIILIDTGLPLESETSPLLEGLGSVGISPKDVNIVFFTHRDGDHVGGSLTLNGEAVYPNARHIMARTEYQDFAKDVARAELFQKRFAPLVRKNLLEIVNNDATIAPGIKLVLMPGHRSGATSVLLESEGEKAVLLADVMHCPVQVSHPEWSIKFDENPELAAKTRAAMLERAEHESLLLAVPHAPFPGLGYVTRDASGQAIWKNAV
jgi:glyoxylase-like metal-dependent hydrolase (beta-lactamase superfamily II)